MADSHHTLDGHQADRPFYISVADEESIFKAAHAAKMPIMLKGPTGCGKTRFVEAMAYDLDLTLITVSCHDDLTTSDLVGRYLLHGSDTIWQDGPLSQAVRTGALCYLDEVVEARQDTISVLHPLADHRRILPIERLNETLIPAEGFGLVVSYNPGYQSLLKDLKPSTRQRMVTLEMGYAPFDFEMQIVQRETGLDSAISERLVVLAEAIRAQENISLREVASTRALVIAGKLIRLGIQPIAAIAAGMIQPLSDDPIVTTGLLEIVYSIFGRTESC